MQRYGHDEIRGVEVISGVSSPGTGPASKVLFTIVSFSKYFASSAVWLLAQYPFSKWFSSVLFNLISVSLSMRFKSTAGTADRLVRRYSLDLIHSYVATSCLRLI